VSVVYMYCLGLFSNIIKQFVSTYVSGLVTVSKKEDLTVGVKQQMGGQTKKHGT